MTSSFKAGILTASDRSHKGEREDKSGMLLKRLFQEMRAEVVAYDVVPDEKIPIRNMLIHMADELHCDVIFTTGGTGLAPRDITPEATREILDREVPGISEALRAAGLKHKSQAMLSRGLAGTRGRTLIVNLPGSPGAVEEAFHLLSTVLAHAVELMKGEVSDCLKSSVPRH